MEQHFTHIREEAEQDWLPQRVLIPMASGHPCPVAVEEACPLLRAQDITMGVARHQPLYLLVRKCSRSVAHFMLHRGGQKTTPMKVLFSVSLCCQLFIISWNKGSIVGIWLEAIQIEKLFSLCSRVSTKQSLASVVIMLYLSHIYLKCAGLSQLHLNCCCRHSCASFLLSLFFFNSFDSTA